MKKTFRAPYLTAGCITIIFLGVIYTWSIFSTYYQKDFPDWTVAQLSMNFTLHNIFSCFGAFVGGKLLTRYRSRSLALIAAALIFAGFLGASLLEFFGGLWLLYLSYGVVASFGLGLSYIISLTMPGKWFPDKPGLVSGLLLAFIGAGSLLLSAIVEAIAPSLGLYTTLRVVGGAGAILVALCSPLMVAPTEKHRLPPPAKQVDAGDGEACDMRTMIRRGSFWLFFFWNVCISSAGLIVLNRVANIAVYFGAAAVAGMVISLFNSGGRLVYGVLIDKAGRRVSILTNNIVLLASGILLLTGSLLDVMWIVFVGLMGTGVAFGANLTLRLAGIQELYGTKYSAENFGFCNLCVIPASIIGPYISGRLQDMEGGAYNGTFIMVIVLAVIAFILDFALRRTTRRTAS